MICCLAVVCCCVVYVFCPASDRPAVDADVTEATPFASCGSEVWRRASTGRGQISWACRERERKREREKERKREREKERKREREKERKRERETASVSKREQA